jgi:hypothetical protein
MKVLEYRCVDYLDWLKDHEETLLMQIESWESDDPIWVKEAQDELQLIREIKSIVKSYEGEEDDE